jgi:hypothetical protein
MAQARSDVAADRADARRQEAAAKRQGYEPGYGMYRGPNGPLIQTAQYFGNVLVFDPVRPPPVPNYSIQEAPRRVAYERDGLIAPREQTAYTHYDPRTNTYYEPLPGGALRVPPGGKAPPGYDMDHAEGSSWVAVPVNGRAIASHPEVLPVPESDRVRAERQAVSYNNGDTNKGWTYSILTIHHWPNGSSYLRPTNFGVYPTKAECEQAQAEKIASLETNQDNVNGLVQRLIQEPHSAGDHGPTETWAPQGCKPYTHQQLPSGSIAAN